MRRRSGWPECYAIGALVLMTAHATPGQTLEDHEKAVAAFKEARALIRAGQCDQAIPKLEASLSFEPSIGTRLSLADCLEGVDPLAAWKQLKEAERFAFTKHDDRVGPARSRAAALESRLALIHIVLTPAALDLPGLDVRLDGSIVDRFFLGEGEAIAVYPGRHRLNVTAPGARPWSQVLEAVVGTTVRAPVQLEDAESPLRDPAASPSPAATPPPPGVPSSPLNASPANPLRTLGLIVGGVGVGVLAFGATAGAVALATIDQEKSDCPSYPRCSENASVRASNGTAQTWSYVSTGAFITGGVLVAGGITLFLTARPAGSSGRAGLRVEPSVTREGAGLKVLGDWSW